MTLLETRQTTGSLRLINEDLSKLIPPNMFGALPAASPVNMIRMDIEVAESFDFSYRPDLSVIMTRKNSAQVAEDTNWGDFLKRRRQKALDRDLIGKDDEVSMSLIAHGPSAQAVEFQSFALTGDLRGLGLGRAFYENFRSICDLLGYKYIFGANEKNNIGFYLKLGLHNLRDLKPEARSLILSRQHAFYRTIDFLDKELEEKYVVKPQAIF